MRHNHVVVIVIGITLAGLSGQGMAASGTWTNVNGGLWSDGGNWNGGVIADGAGSLADFSTLALIADATVTLDSGRTMSSLTFGDTAASHNWIVNNSGGAILTLSGASTLQVTNQTATISAPISGTAALNKTGPGRLDLTYTQNDHKGSTTVSAGTLGLSTGMLYYTGGWANYSLAVTGGAVLEVGGWADADAAGIGKVSFGAGNIVVNGGTIRYTAGTSSGNSDRGFTIGALGTTLEAAGSIAWSLNQGRGFGIGTSAGGLLTLAGVGNGTLNMNLGGVGGVTKIGGGTWTLTGTNSYSGATTVTGGTLKAASASALGSTPSITVSGGGTLDLAGNAPPAGATITLSGTGVGGGWGALGNSGANIAFNNTVTLAGDTSIGGLAYLALSGPFSGGTYTLTKVGAGMLVMNSNATTVGDIQVTAGYLTAQQNGALGNTTYGTTVQSGASLQVYSGGTGLTIPENITINNYGTGSVGAIQASGTGGQNHVLSGTITLGSSSSIGGISGSDMTLTGNLSGAGLDFGKVDANTLTLKGASNSMSTLQAFGGTLALAGTSSTAVTNYVAVGANRIAGGGDGTLAVQDSARLTAPWISIGDYDYCTGIVNQSGGTVTTTGEVRVAHWRFNTSSYTQTGGTLNVGTDLTVGWDGTGTFTENGGNAVITGSLSVGRHNGSILNIQSGTMSAAGLYVGQASGNAGTVNQSGGSLTVNSNVRVGHWGSETSTYNLSNGTLSVPAVVTYVGWDGNGVLNISGGTASLYGLRLAGGDTGTHGGTGALTLTGGRLELGAGGLNYSGGYDTENLGGGTLASTASWSTGAYLQFTGTGGDTTLDTLANTMTLSGNLGGAGGFAKIGSGTLVLSGANTFAGQVAVNAGLVRLGNTSALGGTTRGTVVNGGTLDLAGYAIPTGEAISLAGAGGVAGYGALGSGSGSLSIGNTITLAGDASIGGPNYLALSGPFSGGTYTMTKVGAGMLVMNSNSTTVGPIIVNQGILTCQQNGALGNTLYGTTVNSGATLQFWGPGSDLTVGENITLNAGTLQSANQSNTLTGSVTLANSSTIQTDTPLAISGNVTGTYTLTKTGASTLTLRGVNSLGNISVNGGGSSTLVLAGSSVTNLTGSVGLGAGGSQGALTVQDTAALTAVNLFVGETNGQAGNVTQSGGSITLSGQVRVGHWPNETSTYTMSGGALRITSTSGTNPYGSSEQNGALYLGIDGTGVFNQSGGDVSAQTLVLDNRGDTTGTDTYSMTGGTLTLGQWGIQGNASTQINLGGGTVKASANWGSARPMTLTGTNGNVTFDTTGGTINLTGVLSGIGGLAKAGSGTLTLGNAGETYQGATTVIGGTLLLSGATTNNIPASSLIDVRSGAVLDVTGLTGGVLVLANGQTLIGNGAVNGGLNVAGGSKVSAGASPGHLRINAGYNQANLGTMLVELGGYEQGLSYDWIDVAGSATLLPDAIIDVNWYDGFIGFGPFYILTAGNGITNPDLSGITFDFSGATYGEHQWVASIVSLGGSAEALRLDLVPEPMTMIALGMGLTGLGGYLRRRRKIA